MPTGMGVTHGGGQSLSNAATEETEEEKKAKKKGKKKEVGAAAATGAASGAAGGPVGMIVGAAIGAGGALVKQNQAEKAAAGASGGRPKKRRLAKGIQQYEKQKRTKQMAMATLSQAVFDWAASIR